MSFGRPQSKLVSLIPQDENAVPPGERSRRASTRGLDDAVAVRFRSAQAFVLPPPGEPLQSASGSTLFELYPSADLRDPRPAGTYRGRVPGSRFTLTADAAKRNGPAPQLALRAIQRMAARLLPGCAFAPTVGLDAPALAHESA